MLTAAFRAVVERFNLNGVRLGDAAPAQSSKHTKDYNLTRECVLSAGLDPQTPGVDLQRACGTSLEAAILIGNKIALGQIDSGWQAAPIPSAMRRLSIPAPISSCCCKASVAVRPGSGSRHSSACGHVTSSRSSRPSLSRAPGCRWVKAPSSCETLEDLTRGPGPTRLRESHEGVCRVA